ncbi:hypothetical protein [Limnohabitans sp. T6-20]|uniref:hypothetical protein n=1 Tax=Limnohabitans sp. T6-20 TaxID=1100725 RepID=UPI0011B20A9E|nr:hypothetical protein [Limnohabitans sp. T6-20]
MTSPESALFSDNAPLVVPVLSTVIPPVQIPAHLIAALDARELERASFMGLADDLVESLRPELERMTTELVRRSLQQAWANRFRAEMD